MKYYSQCRQDEFVHILLNEQKDGYFVDIGASRPKKDSNSYFFESIGWNGLCFDKLEYDDFTKIRSSKLILGDFSELDVEKIFADESVPSIVDYLSVDIDEKSADALEKIPFHSHDFKIMTIEHDFYRFGDSLRTRQRDIIKNHSQYFLLCSDVDGLEDGKTFFEDWWINSRFFDVEKIKSVCGGERQFFSCIVNSLKSR